MIELEEINNGDYNGADPLTNEEMIQIFNHSDMSNNMPDGLLRRDVPENFNTTENLNTKKSNAKETLMKAVISNVEGGSREGEKEGKKDKRDKRDKKGNKIKKIQ
ncbi:hypothetical protein RhiirC2_869957 [Rhizophagus irregularis]|uniref:Uncharacterized protein n=1 Tax=Rhizophagus irregularis TaxID=588596 RepID=A0A2N1MMX4_9GLOM|nr:hypothetical protein RhiirC2_869957 [Rhizophagus irregularis]